MDQDEIAQIRQRIAQLQCPARVTWTNDIRKLFTPMDITCMKKAKIDLSDYQSVKVWAAQIYAKVSSGDMPPAHSGEAKWTQQKSDLFGCWAQQGCPEN